MYVKYSQNIIMIILYFCYLDYSYLKFMEDHLIFEKSQDISLNLKKFENKIQIILTLSSQTLYSFQNFRPPLNAIRDDLCHELPEDPVDPGS